MTVIDNYGKLRNERAGTTNTNEPFLNLLIFYRINPIQRLARITEHLKVVQINQEYYIETGSSQLFEGVQTVRRHSTDGTFLFMHKIFRMSIENEHIETVRTMK